MGRTTLSDFRGSKHMKNLGIMLVSASALALAACSGGNQDSVENAELNQPAVEMNDMGDANAAASAEAEALGTQQQQLEQENAAAEDNTVNPEEADEQNVSGM
jgi:hypothetical protein